MPSGKPRPSLISVCSARETTSREASSILFGAYFSMKRSPFALSRWAPSPRAPSVIRKPLPGQRRRVVLDHLHVHQLGADPVGHRDPVAGADQGVGRRLPDLAVAAAGEDHRLRLEQLHRAVGDVARDHPAALAALVHRQRGGEPLLVAGDLLGVLHQLLVEDVHDRLAGDVGDVVGAGRGGAAEGAGAELALLVAVEGDAEVLEVEDLLRRLAAHDLDRVLVAQVVGALDRVEGVRLPGVAGVEGRVDPALGRIGMRADGVDLADDPDRDALLGGRQGGPLSGQAGTDYENVMGWHERGSYRCELRRRSRNLRRGADTCRLYHGRCSVAAR